MSGGVDSSVAAYLLKEKGYEVIGMTMLTWQDTHTINPEAKDAEIVANMLGIPHYTPNFKHDFKQKVIDYFINEYRLGRTPNPCIVCNRFIKWEKLLEEAQKLGADYIATGHYSKIIRNDQSGRYTLKKSPYNTKDQTYVLFYLTQYQLEHTIMPLADYKKEEVREIATKLGLKVDNKPDSQEICFIPDKDYAKFITNQGYNADEPGDFVDINGKVLGRHKGIINYTIGQRKGLGMGFGKPMFVKEIQPDANRVVLAENEEIFSDYLLADNISFMSEYTITKSRIVKAQIRYAHQPANCRIELEDGKIFCKFEEPQRAITPGQAVVFYENDCILCGGIITK